MAQLVARLVRNEKVGGSNPPSSTTGRHPIRMSVFCMPGRVGVVPVVVLLVAPAGPGCGAGPLCVPVGGGPPARSPHASLTARSGRSRGPPWPCRRPPAPRLGPVTAHGHHSLTPPPTGTAAGPHRRPRAPQPGSAAPTGTAVPSGPSGALHTSGAWLLMCGSVCCFEARPGPPPPMGTADRPSGYSGTLHTGGTWCAVVSTDSASTLYAVQSSPCSGC